VLDGRYSDEDRTVGSRGPSLRLREICRPHRGGPFSWGTGVVLAECDA